ncbi:Ubiquilin-1 [Sarcoptes scabiei]|nr:Ubiquilin-1 [Sarcoptes scabiei]
MEEKQAQQSEQSSSSSDATTSQSLINIVVKTSKERESFQIEHDAGVERLRQLVSERYKVEPSKICLIFSGKILKDGDTLENHKMKDGYIVHLVIRDTGKMPSTSTTSAGSSATTTTTNTSSTGNDSSSSTAIPNPTNPSTGFNLNPGSLPSFPNLGMFLNSSGSSLNNLNQMFVQQLNNPEMIRQMLDSPLMQNLYSNPEIFRSILSASPEFQQLVERNPELNHVFSNPEILRQTFDMMRNPAAFQELMRSHDRAMSNLESLPGGYNALRRMYTELQEPMMNAAQEQFGINPFASNTNSTSTTTPSNTENREPLPNPWQRSATSGSVPAPNMNLNRAASGAAGSTRGPLRDFLNLGQFLNNNESSSSPPLWNIALSSNRGARPSMETSDSSSDSVNSLMQRILADSEAMQAVAQIQQGYRTLERVVTERLNNNSSAPSTTSYSTTPTFTTSTGSNVSSATTTTTPSNASNPITSAPGAGTNINSMVQMLQQMFQNYPEQEPEQRYQSQLSQLEAMGFGDRQVNLQALIETFGDIEAAIDRILSRMH